MQEFRWGDILKEKKSINSREYLNKIMEDFLDKPTERLDRIPIGKASRISSLSVRSIRHYCDTGIIKPVFVDEETGYRYFDSEQLNLLFLIKEMRLLGFSLPEIKMALKSRDIPQMMEHFGRRIEDLDAEISELEEKKKKLGYLLANYSKASDSIDTEIPDGSGILITLKEIPCRYVAFINDSAKFVNGLIFQNAYDEIDRMIKTNKLSGREIHMAIFDSPFNELLKNADNFEEILASMPEKNLNNKIDYCIEIDKPDTIRPSVKTIEEGLYACMMYRGEYFGLYKKAYQTLLDWLDEKNFSILGRFVEIYHVTRPMASLGILPITEVQIRIKI